MNKMTEISPTSVDPGGLPVGGGRAGPRRARARRTVLIAVLMLLACAYGIAAYLLVQSVFYRGLIRSVGEWQFARVGGYFPAITCAALYLLFLLPLMGLFLLVKQRQKRLERGRPALEQSMEGVVRLRRFLSVASVTMLLGAIACLGFTPFLPDSSGPPHTIVAGKTMAVIPGEGHARLIGEVDLGHAVRFTRRALFLRREMLIAPVRASEKAENAARFFVELVPGAGPGGVLRSPAEGVLRRNGLPGEIVTLYRAVGVLGTDEHYLLYRSGEGVRWPYYQLALQLGLASLLLGCASWLEDKRHRRLAEIHERSRAADIKV